MGTRLVVVSGLVIAASLGCSPQITDAFSGSSGGGGPSPSGAGGGPSGPSATGVGGAGGSMSTSMSTSTSTSTSMSMSTGAGGSVAMQLPTACTRALVGEPYALPKEALSTQIHLVATSTPHELALLTEDSGMVERHVSVAAWPPSLSAPHQTVDVTDPKGAAVAMAPDGTQALAFTRESAPGVVSFAAQVTAEQGATTSAWQSTGDKTSRPLIGVAGDGSLLVGAVTNEAKGSRAHLARVVGGSIQAFDPPSVCHPGGYGAHTPVIAWGGGFLAAIPGAPGDACDQSAALATILFAPASGTAVVVTDTVGSGSRLNDIGLYPGAGGGAWAVVANGNGNITHAIRLDATGHHVGEATKLFNSTHWGAVGTTDGGLAFATLRYNEDLLDLYRIGPDGTVLEKAEWPAPPDGFGQLNPESVDLAADGDDIYVVIHERSSAIGHFGFMARFSCVED